MFHFRIRALHFTISTILGIYKLNVVYKVYIKEKVPIYKYSYRMAQLLTNTILEFVFFSCECEPWSERRVQVGPMA